MNLEVRKFLERTAIFGGAAAGAVLGLTVANGLLHERQETHERRILADSVVLKYWQDNLAQAALDRTIFIESLPTGCEEALEPYYFDVPDGASVPDEEVADLVMSACAITPEEVSIARESLNNNMRLWTLVAEKKDDVRDDRDLLDRSFVPVMSRVTGVTLGGIAGLFGGVLALVASEEIPIKYRTYRQNRNSSKA